MAENEIESEGGSSVKPQNGGGMMKIILIAVAIIVLVVGSITATLYFAGVIGGGDKADDVSTEHGASSSGEDDTKHGKAKKEPIYYAFDPAFVVNFSDGKSIRYLQVTLEIMTFDNRVVEDVERHMPVIRNNLIMMFSSLNFEVLNTVAGKRKLQDEALSEIKSILLDKTGKEGIEEVYFTGFVMQ